jgi:hypothetical protein
MYSVFKLVWQIKAEPLIICMGFTLKFTFFMIFAEKAKWVGPGIGAVHEHHHHSYGGRSENL